MSFYYISDKWKKYIRSLFRLTPFFNIFTKRAEYCRMFQVLIWCCSEFPQKTATLSLLTKPKIICLNDIGLQSLSFSCQK